MAEEFKVTWTVAGAERVLCERTGLPDGSFAAAADYAQSVHPTITNALGEPILDGEGNEQPTNVMRAMRQLWSFGYWRGFMSQVRRYKKSLLIEAVADPTVDEGADATPTL